MHKRILILLAVGLSGCAQTTYWVKQGGSTQEFDRTQAHCHNQAYFVPVAEHTSSAPGYIANTTISPYGNTARTTLEPYTLPYQSLSDGLGSLGASLQTIAMREQFVDNCMVANGWQKVDKSATALTVETFARRSSGLDYKGTATGYLDGQGTMKVMSDEGDVCVGTFRYTSRAGGNGLIRCSSGDSSAITFTSLNNNSGFGSGTTDSGDTVRFVYGIDGDDKEAYLNGSEP